LVTEAQVQAQEQRSRSQSREMSAQLKQQEDARQELIARSQERIKNGCQSLILNGQSVLIRPGMRGRDGVTGHPLQAGLCVSDAMGATAITDAEGFLVDVLPGPGMAGGELRGALPEPKNKEESTDGYF